MDDVYCTTCNDSRYIEVYEGKWAPCPECNKGTDQHETREEYED